MLERRADLEDLVVLDVQAERAPDAAVTADGRHLLLPRFVPASLAPLVVFDPIHERAGRTHRDAVSAIHAGRPGQRDVHLGRDARREAASSDGDGKGVLVIGSAGFDAAVAEDAFRVVADVEFVVDLYRLRHR